MNGINIVKGTVKTLSGLGVGTVTRNAWRAFTPEDIGVFGKICCDIGGIAAGGFVVYKTDEYLDGFFDECLEIVNTVKEAVNNSKKVEVEVKVEEKKETKKKETKKKSNRKAKKDVIEVEVPPEDIEIVEEVEEA